MQCDRAPAATGAHRIFPLPYVQLHVWQRVAPVIASRNRPINITMGLSTRSASGRIRIHAYRRAETWAWLAASEGPCDGPSATTLEQVLTWGSRNGAQLLGFA